MSKSLSLQNGKFLNNYGFSRSGLACYLSILQFYQMKFLNVYCEYRKAEVFVSVDKIVLIEKLFDGRSRIQLVDGKSESVKVAMAAEDLVKKINGEDKMTIGFRAGR